MNKNKRMTQISARIRIEDKNRLIRFATLMNTNLSEAQIKCIDYLLNHQHEYIIKYFDNWKDEEKSLQKKDAALVSVRLPRNTYKKFQKLVKVFQTSNSGLLRFIILERLKDIGFALGDEFNGKSIDDIQ